MASDDKYNATLEAARSGNAKKAKDAAAKRDAAQAYNNVLEAARSGNAQKERDANARKMDERYEKLISMVPYDVVPSWTDQYGRHASEAQDMAMREPKTYQFIRSESKALYDYYSALADKGDSQAKDKKRRCQSIYADFAGWDTSLNMPRNKDYMTEASNKTAKQYDKERAKALHEGAKKSGAKYSANDVYGEMEKIWQYYAAQKEYYDACDPATTPPATMDNMWTRFSQYSARWNALWDMVRAWEKNDGENYYAFMKSYYNGNLPISPERKAQLKQLLESMGELYEQTPVVDMSKQAERIEQGNRYQ